MKKFIELLEDELGYAEKAGAYTKFGSWYGKNVEFDADYTHAPWCDMFLAWAAHKLGYEEWMGQFAWTVAHAKWFKKQDAWGTKPEPGAFVFYDWGGSNSISRIDHVGVVTRVEGGRIFTIEGNIDGGVAKRKERDTSKVVGYGYPWKIKERLDAKKSMREGHYSADHPGSHKPGTLQLPDQLRPEIPYLETEKDAKIPLSGPKTSTKKKTKQSEAEAPAPKPSPQIEVEVPVPVAGTASSPAVPKSGKHAKHSAADTSAVTTGPIPVITDVAVSTPAPAALGSPAILTSALVATLAMLAITKTRRLRMRPALATATPAPAPRRHRRKGAAPRRAATERPPRRTAEVTGPHRPLLEAAEPVEALKALQETVFPALETIVIPEATSAFSAFSRDARPSTGEFPPLLETAGSLGGFPRRLEATGPIDAIPRRLDATGPINAVPPRLDATGPIDAIPRRLEATRGIGPFAPLPQAPTDSASRPGHTTRSFEPFPLDSRRPTRHPASGFEPFSHTRHAAGGSDRTRHGGFEAFSRTPGAPSEFDAFTPIAASSRGGATGSTSRREHPSGAYCGRRRGREHPAEELTGFATDASPRGRRHRASAVDHQFVEPFAQDTPLRGRRHRSASSPASRPAHLTDPTMAMAGPPSESGPLTPDDAPPYQRPTRHPGSRRGRHRA